MNKKLFKCIFALRQLSGRIFLCPKAPFPWLCQFLSEVHVIQATLHHHRFLGWVHYFFLSKCSNSCWKLCGMRGTVLNHPDMSRAAPFSLPVYWKLCGMQGMLERYTKRGSCCQGAQINDMEELERLIKTLLRRTSLWFLRFMLNQTYTISS